jgi:hypothetical protein
MTDRSWAGEFDPRCSSASQGTTALLMIKSQEIALYASFSSLQSKPEIRQISCFRGLVALGCSYEVVTLPKRRRSGNSGSSYSDPFRTVPTGRRQVAWVSDEGCRSLENAAVFALRREWPRWTQALPNSDATRCRNKGTPATSPGPPGLVAEAHFPRAAPLIRHPRRRVTLPSLRQVRGAGAALGVNATKRSQTPASASADVTIVSSLVSSFVASGRGDFGSWYQCSCDENREHDRHAVISHLQLQLGQMPRVSKVFQTKPQPPSRREHSQRLVQGTRQSEGVD